MPGFDSTSTRKDIQKPFLLGLTGGTGSGKTTLVRLLGTRIPETTVVDLDSYYLDRTHLPPSTRNDLNYDEPAAFDLALLVEHLADLAGGRTVHKPRYCFITHTRIGTERLRPSPFIIVEGLFTLYWDTLRTAFDLKVFLDAPEAMRLSRRIQRDSTARGRSVESVRSQYAASVAPMHDLYVEPSRHLADIVLANDATPDRALGTLLSAVLARQS